MDYSLLVGIHDPSIPPEEDGRDSNASVGGDQDGGDKEGGKSEEDNSDNEEVPSSPISPSARGACTMVSVCVIIHCFDFRRVDELSGGS